MSPVIQNKLSQPRQAGGWKFYNCVCVAKMATDQTCVLPLLSVSVLLWQTVLLIAVPAFKNIALFLRKTSSLSEKKKITVYRYVLRESDWRSRYYMSPKKIDTQSDQRLGGKFCSSNGLTLGNHQYLATSVCRLLKSLLAFILTKSKKITIENDLTIITSISSVGRPIMFVNPAQTTF